MKNILNAPVLVLNRNWQAIEESCVETALCDICRGAKRGIDTETMTALTWEDWIKLPVRENDDSIGTSHGRVRVPRVIVVAWSGMPDKKPKKNRRGVGLRDGFICAYSGEFCPDGTVDHVDPKSNGGTNEWTNLVWSRADINHRKGSQSVKEAGLRLLFKPTEPKAMPAHLLIEPKHEDWLLFLGKRRSGHDVSTSTKRR